jgi:hypothetical protein
MVVEKINRKYCRPTQDSRIWLCMKNASFDDAMTSAIRFEGMNLKGLYSISRILIKDLQRK